MNGTCVEGLPSIPKTHIIRTYLAYVICLKGKSQTLAITNTAESRSLQ